MSAAPTNVDVPGPVDTVVAPVPTSVAAPTSEVDELRAEVVRLRQANHRLIARFATAGRTATPPAAGDVAPETARASMARAAGDLRREVERTVQVRDHLSREWAALHAAKVRLRATWEEIERRRDIVLAREAELTVAEQGLQAQRHDVGRRMAVLARVLDQTLVDPAGTIARQAATARQARVPAEPVPAERPVVEPMAEMVVPPAPAAPLLEAAAVEGASAPDAHHDVADPGPAEPPSRVPTASGVVLVDGLVDLVSDHEEQARFDRFFSDEIETEPSRTWLES